MAAGDQVAAVGELVDGIDVEVVPWCIWWSRGAEAGSGDVCTVWEDVGLIDGNVTESTPSKRRFPVAISISWNQLFSNHPCPEVML